MSKLSAFFAKCRALHTILNTARNAHTRDGNRAAAIVMMYGYFGHNFGDDLFFDLLFRRYPDTVFAVYDAGGYDAFFSRYPNVYWYDRNHSQAQKIDALGRTFGIDDAFERLLLSKSHGVVHIGGSIYQQILDWQRDMEMRKKRYHRSRPFFSVSSNFGPFHTDGYRKFWEQQFRKSHDICFRDTYSCELFADVPTVRHAPDLLFSYPLPTAATVKGRLFLSVIDPASSDQGFTPEQQERYIQNMIAVADAWQKRGGSVCLSSFCGIQNDDRAVNAIAEAVSQPVLVANYCGDGQFDNVLQAICESEYVLATRFHALLFGLSAGKPVLPVTYSQKLRHVLSDMAFEGHILDMDQFGQTDAETVIDLLTSQPLCDVDAQKQAAIGQFSRLDTFIRRKGGTVQTR